MIQYRYPWPASALTRDEMAMLFLARESNPDRISITRLIANAVRSQYGHLAHPLETSTQHGTESTLRPAA